MTDFTPSQATLQKVANKITTAADVAGASLLSVENAGKCVVFTQDQWREFIRLMLADTFKPK